MPTTLEAPPDEPVSVWPLVLRYRPGLNLADRAEFFDFCQDNAPWQIERNPQGEIVVKMPTGGESGNRNFELTTQLGIWTRADGTGRGFDSNTGFDLPNGAMRSPDAAWVRKTRLEALTPEQKRKFLPLTPDFVVELRSETDSRRLLQDKMAEYIENGAALAILLDPIARRTWVYRPGTEPMEQVNPLTLDCSPDLPGFVLDVQAIFDAEI
jgi:Uma2 family endonuclease